MTVTEAVDAVLSVIPSNPEQWIKRSECYEKLREKGLTNYQAARVVGTLITNNRLEQVRRPGGETWFRVKP